MKQPDVVAYLMGFSCIQASGVSDDPGDMYMIYIWDHWGTTNRYTTTSRNYT
jgi:hypothetical protein